MTRPVCQLSPLAQAGADTGCQHSAIAGAVIRLALDDAKAGSRSAFEWLAESDQARRWVSLLGGDGYLDAALTALTRQYRRWGRA